MKKLKIAWILFTKIDEGIGTFSYLGYDTKKQKFFLNAGIIEGKKTKDVTTYFTGGPYLIVYLTIRTLKCIELYIIESTGEARPVYIASDIEENKKIISFLYGKDTITEEELRAFLNTL